MNKKRILFLTAAACGLTALTACSPNWVAGDPPDRFYLDDPVPVPEAKPEAKPEANPRSNLAEAHYREE